MTVEAPQADRLDLVRSVVDAIHAGALDAKAIATRAMLAPRYTQYALQAARMLELVVDGDPPKLTERGLDLVSRPLGSNAERIVLRDAFLASTSLHPVAQLVLAQDAPSALEIADFLVKSSALGLETAVRRSSTLLRWRRYLLPQDDGRQLSLLGMDDGELFIPRSPDSTIQVESLAHPPAALPSDRPADASDGLIDESTNVVEKINTALPDAIEPPPPSTRLELLDEPPTTSAPDPVGQSTTGPLLNDNDTAFLRRGLEQGAIVLLTGAGFSLASNDLQGRPLPTGEAYCRELWALCYGDDAYDGSSLPDVFASAQRLQNNRLRESLSSRFRVQSKTLPDWYRTWFSAPWLKAYTLNVDDLECAAAAHFALPRKISSVSALRDSPSQVHGLEFIHLNGLAADGPSKVTFSVDQFAQRVARQEPYYAQLGAEMLTRSFLFVGSPLDEQLFWLHIQMRQLRAKGAESEFRPKSFLVAPSLTRARVDQLRAYNIVWVQATAQEFAEQVLQPLNAATEKGILALQAASAANRSDESNIVEVSKAAVEADRATEFLLGEEPSWADIREGRAIDRDEDGPLLDRLSKELAKPFLADQFPQVIAVSATAGAGKTTLLKKLALRTHADGVRTAWIAADAEVSPATLVQYYRKENRPAVLVLDDAGRYGSRLLSTLSDVTKSPNLRLVILGMRSYHDHYLSGLDERYHLDWHRVGRLTDSDIDRLLALLEKSKRLGELRALSPAARIQAFRAKAERQILVAMIEATSGERFEDRIVREWREQDASGQYVYGLAALATTNGYTLQQEDVLLACSGGPQELDALKKLTKAHLLTVEGNRYRVRHKVIADTLVRELAARGTQLENLVLGLCRALAIKGGPKQGRKTHVNRVLQHLLNHNFLLRLLDGAAGARIVYGSLEEHLDGDYHFWLQRGCLELEDGEIGHAKNFLEQASALNSSDPLVETAFAHMQLRKSILAPGAPDSGKIADAAFDTLRRLTVARGSFDSYPAHVFGSQALAWGRKAGLIPRARRALLREAKDIVGKALTHHRGRQELSQLFDDIRREELIAT